jgi:cytidine deaminase
MSKGLIDAARRAAKRAYCPYSGFRVGAAAACDDGEIILGCNIENASYELTICAERTAIFTAIAKGKTPVKIAIACPDAPPGSPSQYRMPCGACRQVMAEFLPDTADVFVDGVGEFKLKQLLPEAFRLQTDNSWIRERGDVVGNRFFPE